MPTLWTAGYEGLQPASFIGMLKDSGISLLADVRKIPFSRKPGFSKSSLAAHLKAANIGYRHLVELGNPLKGLARDGPVDYRSVYNAHLDTAPAQAALAELIALSQTSRVCILCFERNVCDCHRALIAARLERTHNFDVVHLAPPEPQAKFAF